MALFSSQLSSKEMVPLCRQLATSYNAGLPILQTLALVGRGIPSRRIRGMLDRMATAIRNGSSLHEAARAEKNLLPNFFTEVVAAGEVGGHLDVMLRDLAEYYEDQANMQRTVQVAMVYPGLQLAAAWFLGSFSLGLVGRINIGRASGGAVDIWKYIMQWASFQVAAMATAFVVFMILVAVFRAGGLQYFTGFFKNLIWPIRPIHRKYALARFFRGMSLLVGAGMSMKDCITRSAALTMNPFMQKDLLKAVPVVMNGGSLVEAFSGTRCLSEMGRQMLLVGEQTGNLEISLKKVSEYHFEEAKSATRVGITVMGVLVLLIVGAIIGYVVISFYSGLYSGLDKIG